MRKLSCFLLAVFLSHFSYATTVVSPKFAPFSCIPFKPKSQDSSITIGAANSPIPREVYLLKNTSSKSIWLDHVSNKSSASASWSSYLRPNNGAAIVLNKKDFALTCSVIEPGKVVTVNCFTAISVCLANTAVINPNRKGSYWLIEDKPWEDLVKIINKKVTASHAEDATPNKVPIK